MESSGPDQITVPTKERKYRDFVIENSVEWELIGYCSL